MNINKVIGLVVIFIMCINITAYANNVKLVSDNKPSLKLFSFFKKKIPDATKASIIEDKIISASKGTLSISKNTVTDGKLSFTSKTPLTAIYTITSAPSHGTINLTDTSNGYFTYTPNENYLGLDTFVFSVLTSNDENSSATVDVSIEEAPSPTPYIAPNVPKSNLRYEDMLGHWGELSALKLANEDIIKGMEINNKYYFYPDLELTRGDFILYLISALKLDITPYKEINSPFADSAEIPAWISLQAKAAYDAGLIKGSLENNNIYLKPYDKLTRIETISILNNTIKPNVISMQKQSYADIYLVPQWADEAVQNMTAYGLLKGYDDNTVRPYVKITRAMSAEFLNQILTYKQKNPIMMENINSAINKK